MTFDGGTEDAHTLELCQQTSLCRRMDDRSPNTSIKLSVAVKTILSSLTVLFVLITGVTVCSAQPTVTSISPSSATAGSTVPVTITGTGFVAGATSVSLIGTGGTTTGSINL